MYALKAFLQVKRKDACLMPTIKDINPYINFELEWDHISNTKYSQLSVT